MIKLHNIENRIADLEKRMAAIESVATQSPSGMDNKVVDFNQTMKAYLIFLKRLPLPNKKAFNLLHRIITVKWEHLRDDRKLLTTFDGRVLSVEEWTLLVKSGVMDAQLLCMHQFGKHMLMELKKALD